MGDSILNFSDLEGDNQTYTGFVDTTSGFSGSSTLQDVQPGSPLQLDTSYGPSAASVTDFVSVPTTTYDGSQLSLTPNQTMATQSLTGASDTPPSTAAQQGSSKTPNVAPPNNNTSMGLSALSKFGASMASLFAGPATQHAAVPGQVTTTPGGATLVPGGSSGTTTLILLIVVGALIVLLARGE